jgi:hypothetical protein
VLEQLIDPIPEGENPEAVHLNRVLINLSCRTDLLDELLSVSPCIHHPDAFHPSCAGVFLWRVSPISRQGA